MDGGVRGLALPLRDPADLDPLVERVGDACAVAVGEAGHGTQHVPPLAHAV